MTTEFQDGRRRILKRLRIDELSAVDVPAKASASAVIMKRADSVALLASLGRARRVHRGMEAK